VDAVLLQKQPMGADFSSLLPPLKSIITPSTPTLADATAPPPTGAEDKELEKVSIHQETATLPPPYLPLPPTGTEDKELEKVSIHQEIATLPPPYLPPPLPSQAANTDDDDDDDDLEEEPNTGPETMLFRALIERTTNNTIVQRTVFLAPTYSAFITVCQQQQQQREQTSPIGIQGSVYARLMTAHEASADVKQAVQRLIDACKIKTEAVSLDDALTAVVYFATELEEFSEATQQVLQGVGAVLQSYEMQLITSLDPSNRMSGDAEAEAISMGCGAFYRAVKSHLQLSHGIRLSRSYLVLCPLDAAYITWCESHTSVAALAAQLPSMLERHILSLEMQSSQNDPDCLITIRGGLLTFSTLTLVRRTAVGGLERAQLFSHAVVSLRSMA